MNYFVSCPRSKDFQVTGRYPSDNYIASLTLTQSYCCFQELTTVATILEEPEILIVFDLYNVVDDLPKYFEERFNIRLEGFTKVFLIVETIREGMRNTGNVEIVRAEGAGAFNDWMGTRAEFEKKGSNQSVESHQ
jgi:hypothetical protein